MVTRSTARSLTGSSSVATSRSGSRRAKSPSAVEDDTQHSPINLASESPDANSNADSDVEMLGQDEGPEKKWFKEIVIDEPEGFDRSDYEFLDSIVDKVLEEEVDENGLGYRVRFRDRHEDTVSIPIYLTDRDLPSVFCYVAFVRVSLHVPYIPRHPSFTSIYLTPHS